MKRNNTLSRFNSREKKAMFDLMFDLISDGIIIIDLRGTIIAYNDSMSKITGFKAEEVVGKNIEIIDCSSNLIEVIRTNNPINKTKHFIKDKSINITMQPIVKNKEIVGAIGVFKDISQIEDLSRKLHEIETLYNDLEVIVDNAYDLITITDGNGIVLRASSALERVFGVKTKDFVGENVVKLEKNGVVSRSVTSMVLETKKRQSIVQDTKGGRRLAVKGIPIFTDKGDLFRVINFSQDITEVSILRSKLEETEELLKSYYQEIKEFRNEKKQQSLIVRGTKMIKIMELVKRVATVESTVLITGESGVGKEVVARAIHDMSYRYAGPFIKINCGAIPETLLESELFGYEKGAFTGARKEGKKGLAFLADKGSLFLDEIGDLPMSLQVKVLQLIQDKTFYPIGSSVLTKVDIRIIAATNLELKNMVEQNRFREDLYYRLNVVPINVPPLRERKDEIPILVSHFIKQFNEKYLQKKTISPECLEELIQYNWPGNVRELENMIERLVVTTDCDVIETQHLPSEIQKVELSTFDSVNFDRLISFDKAVEQYEKELLKAAYQKYKRTNRVAKMLGLHRSTVTRKIKKYYGKSPQQFLNVDK